MALSIAIKICDDTSGMNGLSPMLLVFCKIPRMPVSTKELPLQSETMRAIEESREQMKRTISLDRIKTALAWNFPSAADSKLFEGTEVLIIERSRCVNGWIHT